MPRCPAHLSGEPASVGPVGDLVIANPIINGPYDEPARHFRFDADGITDQVDDGRRPSSYIVPVPRPRKGRAQLEIPELTADQIEVNQQVNAIRARVDIWRSRRYDGVTPTTRRLLEHWADGERDNRILFAQREAAETAIYLAEAAPRHGDVWIGNDLAKINAEHNDGLPRVALKMATGTGKTVVMAMLIAWQTLNKVASAHDKRYAKRFLVVAPGITIRERLRVLRPEDAENYYRLRDLVPADLWPRLGQARIAITNFHGFLMRDRGMGKGASSLTKAVLSRGGRSPFLETPDQVAARVLADLGGGSSEVVVFNDEAHHCYRGRAAPEEGAATEQNLTGDERADAKERNAEARVWFTGLSAVHRRVGIKTAYDLSATPFFLSGSGYREGTLFPWVVSDFSLIDAIESGLVKIPRVPVDDDRVASRVTYLNLWHEVRDHLPRKSRRDVDLSGPPNPPVALEGALQSLYGSYVKAFDAWEASDAAARGETPPVFIVVCNNTTVSKVVFDWVAGWQRTGEAAALVPGRLGLFSNVVDGAWTPRPRTILVDSAQLESGESMSAEFKAIARTEIEEFKDDYRRRFPGRSTDDITDEDLLREVLNSVGKQGRLGEHVRCVVSVSMLTEGWDANTVSHILGVRAFGTQLLCEQVVGRGLRRRSYAVDPDTGCFTPEYADVYGVPFQFIPTVAPTKDLTAKPTRRVHAEPDRATAEIGFPRLVGYRVELPDASLFADLEHAEPFVVTTDSLPTYTLVTGVVGRSDVHELDELRDVREQAVVYEVARVLVDKHLSTADDPRPWYFPQAVGIVRDWMRRCVTYHDDTFPGLLLLSENTHHAAERCGTR